MQAMTYIINDTVGILCSDSLDDINEELQTILKERDLALIPLYEEIKKINKEYESKRSKLIDDLNQIVILSKGDKL
ncbi:hypothetical protein FDI40_gp011 [Agrobacterium phage Atu_ph07]|uniref:Uncharacterized protein n=1 Tax=Agrobacterium phage Atu_ph07 TaxID=2024264 RepID=A0A2L0UZ65_9CAUD|nr:hypothetical protein FDI40_gp011 [Agrobacterium phage Atu_ph07]AUZ94823.1 hypothetical protein [Agrobacterium phage Atu_ph07]